MNKKIKSIKYIIYKHYHTFMKKRLIFKYINQIDFNSTNG